MAKYEQAAPKVLELIENGATYKDAAEQAGITEHTFYDWMKSKPQFSQSVHKAKEVGDKKAINDVERSLLDLAKGFEYEEVRTEYESKLNDKTGKYEPTIKKQVRTKKRVVPSTEAIKFFLSNKAPEQWKNRIEQNTTGNLETELKITHVAKDANDKNFPSSESEVED